MDSLLQSTLNLARAEAQKHNIPATAARRHQLILLAQLKAGKDTYNFSFAEADQQAIARDFALGLRDKDAFLMNRMALLLLSVPIVNGKENFTAAEAYSWPDPAIFAGAAADVNSLSEKQQLEPIYHGRLGLTTNNDVRLEDFYTRPFRTVHTTQAAAATSNEVHGGCEFVEFGTVFSLNGFEKNYVQLQILSNDKSQLGGAADRNTYAMIVADGAIIKNLTSGLFTK